MVTQLLESRLTCPPKNWTILKQRAVYYRKASGAALMGELLRDTCVLPQPSFKHFSLKSPLATDFKRWKLLLSHQSIDGESVHVEVLGDLLKRKQLFWHVVARLEIYCTKGKRLLHLANPLSKGRAMPGPVLNGTRTAHIIHRLPKKS